MRLGEAAKNLGVNPDTLVNWITRFPNYFSTEARHNDGKLQRDINDADLLTLNTIRVLRATTRDWEKIEAALASGKRELELPPDAQLIEGKTPIQVYQNVIALQQQLDQSREELARVRAELAEIRREKDDLQRETGKQKEALQREIGKLEGQVEMLREMLAKKE